MDKSTLSSSQHSASFAACCAALCLCVWFSHVSAQPLAQDLNETVTRLPVTVKNFYGRNVSGDIIVTQFKPAGAGPFPLVIINHGRSATDRSKPPRFRYTQQVRFFTERGYAVFVPTRLGYGDAGVEPDPEESGNCNQNDYGPMAAAASTEVLAVLDYAKLQPYVNPERVLLVGESVGGYVTTAVAARMPPGLVAAINFAGGAGGDPDKHPGVPCQGGKLESMYAEFGKTSKAPMLWVYTENDLFFGPQYSRQWYAAFSKAGGQAEYKLLPPFGKNGHTLFSAGTKVWAPVVEDFLSRVGLQAAPLSK
ncbi:alpha/beta hydrolase family protein [Collimonas pratensis]|uniref:Dienelactone hydrolase family protein n=1 Tax=Collimonas pratensis TaxID=279113 RepID=A0A127QC58_9BURK|nr:alpha/beta fold hydrolase [Collimonas pratensis]AMP07620.1 dienelactone hydrolase family protein [Collimonas pratensis]